MVNWKSKYLEYKLKYLNAKNKLIGGEIQQSSSNQSVSANYGGMPFGASPSISHQKQRTRTPKKYTTPKANKANKAKSAKPKPKPKPKSSNSSSSTPRAQQHQPQIAQPLPSAQQHQQPPGAYGPQQPLYRTMFNHDVYHTPGTFNRSLEEQEEEWERERREAARLENAKSKEQKVEELKQQLSLYPGAARYNKGAVNWAAIGFDREPSDPKEREKAEGDGMARELFGPDDRPQRTIDGPPPGMTRPVLTFKGHGFLR